MSCRLVMTLLSEAQEGECGVDWKYELDVTVSGEGTLGEGKISVPRHVLPSGVTQPPHGSPQPLVVYSGDCLTELQIRLQLTATELDIFVNDVGTATVKFKMPCPGPGSSKSSKEVDITAGVKEAPSLLNKHAVFSTIVRFELICE
jgi:hypothetical protein